MSLTRKAPTAAKKKEKPRRQDLVQALAERDAELAEARLQQAATAEILKVIAASPADVQPVFDAIAARANRLIGGFSTTVLRFVGNAIQLAAFTPVNPEADQALKASHPRPVTEFPPFELVRNGESVEFADTESEDVPPFNRELARLRGYRSTLHTPLMSNGAAIGMVIVTRKEPGAFAAADVKLLRTFADQAVIAVNNVGLFNETQEALKQQTATADVLKVISRSAFDLQAVLDTLAESAVSLCGARNGVIYLKSGDLYELKATTATAAMLEPELFRQLRQGARAPSRGSAGGRVFLTGEVQNIGDVRSDPDIDPALRSVMVNRALLGVPLKRGDELLGAFVLARPEPGAFNPRQVEIVQTFADQAVIAIENVRLIDEVQARTRDLEESLTQQTATADVLKAISRTAFDLDTVLETLISTAVRLCNATQGGQIFRRHGDAYRYAASQMEVSPAYLQHEQAAEIRPGRGTLIGRVALESRTVEIADAWNDPEYAEKDEVRETNLRAMLGVPLMRDGEPIGAFALARSEPIPFTPRQVELVTTFADQAVIAIENVRLFDEVQAKTRDLEESLQQQTATADVLKVISRSAFDLDAVFDALLTSAVSLVGSRGGTICVRDGDGFKYRAVAEGRDSAIWRYLSEHPPTPGRASVAGRVLLSGRPEIITDSLLDSDLKVPVQALAGSRSVAGVPLLRDDKVEGALMVGRAEAGPFDSRQIELLQTFADQAVIAIENVRLFDEVQARTRDLAEALQQQTATADVLKVISRSAFDLPTVLDTLVASAAGLIGASNGLIYLQFGDIFEVKAATKDWNPETFRLLNETPHRPGRRTVGARVLLTGEVQNIADMQADPDYDPAIRSLSASRALLGVPLKRGDAIIGAFVLARREAGAFSQREIELVQTFADQAVIAIENVRLFDEVQARTRDLEESLQQQTATADVLKVISRSAFDLPAVLRTLVESAAKLCDAEKATITREINGVYYRAETYGFSEEFMGQVRNIPVVPERGSISGRTMLEGKAVQAEDVEADPEYWPKNFAKPGELRTGLGIPMMRNGAPIGVLALMRTEVRPFNARQIELVQTFADQAVIAIENARLFNEVQAKTRDLEESLQQQTATADVLKVISRSAFELQTVLDTLASSAAGLIVADFAVMNLRRDDAIRVEATFGCAPEFVQYLADHAQEPGRKTLAGRVFMSGEVQNIPDVLADPEYDFGAAPKVGSFRALLGVPMFRDGKVEGSFTLGRKEPGPFTQRQIELVQTFADQAVIAIENARLFDEVQAKTRDLEESLQQQTATADVLKVISRSAFDLQAVFDTLIASAVELSGSHSGAICVRDGDIFRYRSSSGPGASTELHNYLVEHPANPGRGSIVGRAVLSRQIEQIRDIREDPEYSVPITTHGNPARALVGVPLLGKDGVEGAIVLTRLEPGAFPKRQIEILQTFADQAVIAIENARLFDEVQARTRELAASLDDLRKAQDRLIQSEKLASLGQLTAGIAHEIKNPLNFINNFSALSRELIGELSEARKGGAVNEAARAEADELIGAIDGNLAKIVQHGKRADSIVKNMLLHSREGSGERLTTNVNAMVEEALNLAYHGARAEKPGFNVTIMKSLDPNAGAAEVYTQEMTRVLLNLISNGFYATSKRKQSARDGAYEPTISASTRDLGPKVEIAIRDNGTGISDEVKAKMFNPFFTTKPAGEGTGLGLSLSHDIVVKQHGGAIEVSTEPNAFTQFTIVLPRGAVRS